MFRKFKQERLKDILIDHIFDYCYNEIVQKVEGDGISMSVDHPDHFKDPRTKFFVDLAATSGSGRLYYGIREKEYCEILVAKNRIHKSLMEKLQQLGFSYGNELYNEIKKAHDFLIARSYLAKNKPKESEVKLTNKGLKHYLDGKSFEDEYIKRRNSNAALIISIISITIALLALIFSRTDVNEKDKIKKGDKSSINRTYIHESVHYEIWKRDQGKCVRYGSQTNLEFDHIIPVSKGGSNTARNVQLLCEKCNRQKSDKI